NAPAASSARRPRGAAPARRPPGAADLRAPGADQAAPARLLPRPPAASARRPTPPTAAVSDLSDTRLQSWRDLPPSERRQWFEQLWLDTIALRDRYQLALRSGWWQDSVVVEAIAAFCAWLDLYDTGAYTDPQGKLGLLWQLDQLKTVLRGGEQAFDPARD